VQSKFLLEAPLAAGAKSVEQARTAAALLACGPASAFSSSCSMSALCKKPRRVNIQSRCRERDLKSEGSQVTGACERKVALQACLDNAKLGRTIEHEI